MPTEKNPMRIPIFLIFVFVLGLSLFINIPVLQKEFLFADQSTYFASTQSLAYDFDLEYSLQGQDLNRYYRKFPSGPQGIFLKKGKDGKIFFAKSFIYPLFSTPFLRIFGTNGFFVFHTLLLILMLLMGYKYFSLHNPPLLSLLTILTFLFASVAMVYFIWISPDFFNIFMAFSVIFLWLYKHKYREAKPEEKPKKRGILRFLLSDGSDYLAAALAGMAFFAKPPNIILLGPLVVHALFKKKFVKTAIILLIFITVSGAFWGTNYLVTGEWNYQGGERKTFYTGENRGFPFEAKNLTFENTGLSMTSEGYEQAHRRPAMISVYNFFYYFVGRFTGVIWYFFPAFLFLIVFIMRKKSWEQWLVFCAIFGGILIYIVLMPDNYSGGGGSLANRYFLSIYPLFLFLPGIKRNSKELISSWLMAAIFISPILISPFLHSQNPATHAKKLPFKLLPVEMSLVNNHPTMTNPEAFREVGTPENKGWLYFLDDNYNPKHLTEDGFWTKGDRTCEMILKTWFPVKELRFLLLNNPHASNEIKVKMGGKTQKITLGSNQRTTLSVSPKRVFKVKDNHFYRIKIKASEGSIPYFEYKDRREGRFLGVFFGLEIVRRN